ncbi:MAG: OBG GTPase family GTP-binding protein [Methanobacterium sp.]
MALEDRIKQIEEEIKKTPYNKATSHHIGKLKAKLSKLKEESLQRSSKGTKGKGFHVKKSGDATVVLVGFPSVGKSTLLNDLTNAESKIAEYEFTTLEIIPGIMEYNGAKIQIFDIPGIITGASSGKGRGREILSVARNADLILVIMDVFNPQHYNIIVNELRNIGIRPNEERSDVTVNPKKLGGLNVSSTVELTNIDEKTIRSVLNEYGIHSADVLIRDDVNVDQFIDSLDVSCKYIPTLMVVNKIDLAQESYLNEIKSEMEDALFISADKGINVEELKRVIFDKLDLIRIYLKPQGKKADLEEPLIVRKDSTVKDVANKLHRDFIRNFRHAKVWGTSVKFDGQKVGLDHVLYDGDILRFIIKK